MNQSTFRESVEKIIKETFEEGQRYQQHFMQGENPRYIFTGALQVEAISNLVEEEVKKALSDLQTRRYNHKCICCTSNFDNIAFKIKELSNE